MRFDLVYEKEYRGETERDMLVIDTDKGKMWGGGDGEGCGEDVTYVPCCSKELTCGMEWERQGQESDASRDVNRNKNK